MVPRRLWLLLGVVPLLNSCFGSLGLNASISVSGQVEDEQGQPMEDVQLHVSQGRADLTSESFTSYKDRTLLLENGQFRIACSNCSSMQMQLSKPGYHSETRSFSVREPATEQGDRSTSAAEDFEQLDLRIVMRSSANAVQLVSYSHHLLSSSTEVIRVAPLRRDLGQRGATFDQLNRRPGSTADWLPGYVQLKPSGAEYSSDLKTSTQRTRTRVRAVVDFSEADGGVVLHTFDNGSSGAIYREMRTAPATGYQPELTLDTEDGYGSYFFYCRIGNQYCKGQVNRPELRLENGEILTWTSIELRMNPDGGRNLETTR